MAVLNHNAVALQQKLQLIPQQIPQAFRAEFEGILREFNTRFRAAHLSGRPGLRVRSGRLRSSFQYAVIGSTISTLRGLYFSNMVYAPVHEFSARIVPKRAGALTIPVRGSAAEPRMGVQWRARTFKNTFIRQHAIWQRKEGGELERLFWLRKSVFIPKRLGLHEAWQANASNVQKRLSVVLQRVLASGEA